jgi:aldose 1-epimerase
MRSILIRCESSEVIVHPQAGASIGHWIWHGRPILYAQVSTSGDRPRVEEAACFPMVPFANRIGLGRLANGSTLAPHPGEAHALHGIGWQRAWDPVAVDAGRVLLGLRHAADEHWPFDFTAQLDIKLGPDGLGQMLTVRNTGRHTMPAGLGLHPYFPVDATTTLTAAWTGHWTVGADLLPVEHRACTALNAEAIGGWTVNNCFTGWDGRATLTYGDRQVSMSGSFGTQAGFVQCYRPGPDSPFLALEPVTHIPNAHQLEAAGVTGTGLRHLGPGESMSVSMDIAVV